MVARKPEDERHRGELIRFMRFCHSTLLVFAACSTLIPIGCGNDAVVLLETPSIDGDGASGTITVMPGMTYQTMDGFGTSMRLWDDPHINAGIGGIVMTNAQKDTIYDLLYSPTAGIGLNRLRVLMIEPGWQKAEGAKIVTDGPYPGPHATAMLDFIRNARIRNPTLKTGFQVLTFDGWITKSTSPPVVATYIKTALDYAKSNGHEPDWVGIQNEPSISPPYFSGENLRDIAIELKKLLKAGGYATMISAPDDVTDIAGAFRAASILADPESRSSIKALSIHLYGDLSPTQTADLAQQYNLPLWMTEYDDRNGGNEIGWASAVVHEMIVAYNCSAVDMLFGFLGQQDSISGNARGSYIELKSTGTTYMGYALNPSYYQVGHWSKYVTRGSVRIAAASTNPSVKVSAFTKDGKKVIVLIHTGTSSESVAIPAGAYRLIRTQMSGSDRLAYKGVFTSAVTLPRMSITTLVER